MKTLIHCENPSNFPPEMLRIGDFDPENAYRNDACGSEISYRKPPRTCIITQIFSATNEEWSPEKIDQ
jgi:hypothetical protein